MSKTLILSISGPRDLLETIPRAISDRMVRVSFILVASRATLGQSKVPESSWAEIGHQMKTRLNYHLKLYPIADWSQTVKDRKRQIIANANAWPDLTKLAMNWHPPDPNSLLASFVSR